MNEWSAKLEPVLLEQEARPQFDVHVVAATLIERFPEENVIAILFTTVILLTVFAETDQEAPSVQVPIGRAGREIRSVSLLCDRTAFDQQREPGADRQWQRNRVQIALREATKVRRFRWI